MVEKLIVKCSHPLGPAEQTARDASDNRPGPLTHAVIGTGNGGKTTAADLKLQGEVVRLFEMEQWRSNLDELWDDRYVS